MLQTVAWTLVAVLTILVASSVLARVSLPMYRIDLQVLKNLLFTLYRHGNGGAFLRIRIREAERDLRVYKAVREVDDVRLILAVPQSLATPSLLSQAQFLNLRVTRRAESWSAEECTIIDCGSTWKDAVRLVVTAATGGSQVGFDGRCDARMFGMHPDLRVQPGFSTTKEHDRW